ncbi:MAG: hypothetical protein ACOCSF_06750 [Halanaeroarchaeum sp.]
MNDEVFGFDPLRGVMSEKELLLLVLAGIAFLMFATGFVLVLG